MRILLDESLPRRLREELKGHTVSTVPEMGWSGMKNGDLLQSAEGAFDVFLTADQNLQFQQNLESLLLATVVLAARDNTFATLRGLIPRVLVELQTLSPGSLVRVEK